MTKVHWLIVLLVSLIIPSSVGLVSNQIWWRRICEFLHQWEVRACPVSKWIISKWNLTKYCTGRRNRINVEGPLIMEPNLRWRLYLLLLFLNILQCIFSLIQYTKIANLRLISGLKEAIPFHVFCDTSKGTQYRTIFMNNIFTRLQWIYAVGYSDFHNLMRFTSEKMPNNILKNVC